MKMRDATEFARGRAEPVFRIISLFQARRARNTKNMRCAGVHRIICPRSDSYSAIGLWGPHVGILVRNGPTDTLPAARTYKETDWRLQPRGVRLMCGVATQASAEGVQGAFLQIRQEGVDP